VLHYGERGLKLYSCCDIDGVEIKDKNYSPHDYKTICGICDLSYEFTLTDCKFVSCTHFMDNLFEIVYEPTFSYSGGLFYNHDNTLVTQLTCTFPYLGAWYDTNRIFFGSHSQGEIDHLKRAISSENLKTTIKIDTLFSIEIERYYEQNDNSFSKEVSVEIKHFVSFKNLEPIPLSELKKKAYSFMQLMMTSLGKQMYVDFKFIIIETNELEKSENPIKNRLNIVYFSNYRKRNVVKSDKNNKNGMLFYGGEGNWEQLNQIIVNWYNSYDEFSTIYGIYLDTFEWFQDTDIMLTEVMFKNRFTNLVQALESYHRLTDSKYKYEDETEVIEKAKSLVEHLNPVDKEWIIDRISPKHVTLSQRLKNLICCELSNITSLFFNSKSEMKSFINHIKDIRNEISHGKKVTPVPPDIGICAPSLGTSGHDQRE